MSDDDREREPLADLREDVERRREEDDDDDFEELFTDVDVGSVDQDEVWDELSESADEPVADAAGVDAAGVDEPADSEHAADDDVRVVEKRLCQECPHFTDPPQTACTHDGTTIAAEVDTDHFRVVNCPVVAAREDDEASDFSAESQ
ncbi:hypothetical protein [Halobacterium sp. R2-5]|uniref:hypothetical protein n=1 Tax=Halobacterium sp. R2-5 TaxID=2715751 RepID=UPI001422B91B|nr:hypothetical protein [Halobacterium sp. R2-5]NIC00066.1 hypothetical protein [Halobacterium sp. R2-5]